LFSLPGQPGISQNFVQKAYSNWTKLNGKVKAHSTSSVHVKCVLAMESYKDAHSGKQPTIDTALDLCRKSNYDLNCQRLDAIIDCTILCRKQNIRHSDADSSQSTNKDKAILEFRALGDPLLQKHLERMHNIPVQNTK